MKATVEQMLIQHEGKTLEFKAHLASSTPFLKTVVAFANTAGGTILFGIEDRTRRVVGVADPLELESRIANRSFDEEPLPDLDSEAIDFRAASEFFAPLRRLTRQDLSVLGLTARHGGKAVPTVGVVLLFRHVRDERFPFADGHGHTTAEVAKIIGRISRATRTRLAYMGTRGLVREVGTSPRDPKRKYYLATKER